jgi:hypothetical protein
MVPQAPTPTIQTSYARVNLAHIKLVSLVSLAWVLGQSLVPLEAVHQVRQLLL